MGVQPEPGGDPVSRRLILLITCICIRSKVEKRSVVNRMDGQLPDRAAGLPPFADVNAFVLKTEPVHRHAGQVPLLGNLLDDSQALGQRFAREITDDDPVTGEHSFMCALRRAFKDHGQVLRPLISQVKGRGDDNGINTLRRSWIQRPERCDDPACALLARRLDIGPLCARQLADGCGEVNLPVGDELPEVGVRPFTVMAVADEKLRQRRTLVEDHLTQRAAPARCIPPRGFALVESGLFLLRRVFIGIFSLTAPS